MKHQVSFTSGFNYQNHPKQQQQKPLKDRGFYSNVKILKSEKGAGSGSEEMEE